jgi:hypothetical protein
MREQHTMSQPSQHLNRELIAEQQRKKNATIRRFEPHS